MNSDQCYEQVDVALGSQVLADDVYAERAMLISLLAEHYPAWRYIDANGEDCFKQVICLQLPTGQASWHIHEKDVVRFFGHIPMVSLGDLPYDGHTTQQKYARILALRRRA